MIDHRLEKLLLWLDHNPKRMWFLAFALGAILALGQAPVSLPIGIFISIPILGYCGFHTQTWKQAFGVGWWAAFGYFTFGLIWLIGPFFVEPEKHAILAPFALAAMSAGLALFWGAAFASAKIFQRGQIRYYIGLAVTLVCAEYLRSILFTGFPWGLLAYSWIQTPVAQVASIIGPYGLTFVTILGGLLIVAIPKYSYAGPAISFLLFGALFIGGQYRMPTIDKVERTLTHVRLIQPNAPQHQKWDRDWIGVFFRRGLELTNSPAEKPIDLIVWPETSVPFGLEDNVADLQILSDAAGPNAHIIAGIRRFEGNNLYNSLVHMDGKGGILTTYDKSHLVPFGEYFPYADYVSTFGFRGLAANLQGFSPGDEPRVISTPSLPTYLPMICYEAIFPLEIRTNENRPEFLLHITNDAWFGDYVGPFQHLVQVQFRAIEQGLPVARSANTGVSAMIGPYGRILERLALNEKGYLDADLPHPLSITFYARYGELPLFIVLLLCGLGAKYVTFKSNVRHHDQ